MKTRQRPVIGFFTHNLIGDYLEQQWLSLQEHAEKCDVSLQIYSPFLFYAQKVHREGFLRTFDLATPDNIDALIVSGASLSVFFTPEQIDQLYHRFEGIPVITVAAQHPGVASVVVENRQGFYQLTRHLIVDHGLREVAFVSGTPGNFDAKERQQAFESCLADNGITLDPGLMATGDFGRASGRTAVETIWRLRKRKPQALICSNDDMALGALEELTALGLRVPEDVAVVGFDNIEEGHLSQPALTTVDQRYDLQINAALDAVLAGLRGEALPSVTKIETTVVQRGSCGCLHGQTTTPAFARRRAAEAITEKGYNIGHLTTFTKNVGEALGLDVLARELRELCKNLRIPSFFVGTYLSGEPVGAQIPPSRSRGQVFVHRLDGRDLAVGNEFEVGQLVDEPQAFHRKRRTSVISELVFQDDHYGYCVIEAFQTDPLLYQLINLEVSNCFRHIHSKRRMDEAFQRLEELDRMKNDFIANITHDFRSPLTVTMGMSELGMQETAASTEDHRRHRAVFEASLKLKATVDRFLDLTQMDHKGLKIRAAQVDPAVFLEDLAGFYRSSLLRSKVTIVCEGPPEVPQDFFTDQDKLEEILNNLISNALKFVHPETGRIHLRWEADQRWVRFFVIDNGQGIPPEQLESIFERFTQLSPNRNQRYRGTGIGLAFSRQLAGYLKGSLEGRSKGLGWGAQFILTLPRGRGAFLEHEFRQGPAGPIDNESHRSEVRSLLQIQIQERDAEDTSVELEVANTETEYDLSKAVILIIEDNRLIREFERECLRSDGYRNFILSADGKKGLEAAQRYQPDLILCDLNMPGLRGDEVFIQLTESHDFKRTPFVFVSAVADQDFVRKLKQRGVEVFLNKPIDTVELLTAVRQQLKNAFERRRLERESMVDELTGLLNRRTLMRQIDLEFSHRSFLDYCVVFVDVDRFKRINDEHGHPAGDQVLAAVGRTLRAVLRPYDLCGRYGGEEFLILLPHTTLASGLKVAEKLRRKIEALSLLLDGIPLKITASFGIASLKDHEARLLPTGRASLASVFEPEASEDTDWVEREQEVRSVVEKLIELADQGLYRAKARGRNRVETVEIAT